MTVELERHMIIEGTYTPLRTDDLRPQFLPLIGKRMYWYVDAPGDEGSYAGQWRLIMPVASEWIPECDVSDIVIPEDHGAAMRAYYDACDVADDLRAAARKSA